MKKIEFSDASAVWKEVAPTPERGPSVYRMMHLGDADRPQLFEVKIGPNEPVGVHAHFEDEIIYVVSGAIQFGQHLYSAGSSLSIPGKVLYAFRAGPEGVHYLNFRVCQDRTNFTRAEVEQLQKLDDADQEKFRRAHLDARAAEFAAQRPTT